MSTVASAAAPRRRRRGGPHQNQASVSSSRDASEEDNDEFEPVPASTLKSSGQPSKPHSLPHSNLRHKRPGVPVASLLMEDDGVDSPNSTYDGDVESSMPTGAGHHSHRRSSLSSIVKGMSSSNSKSTDISDAKRVPAVMPEEEIRAFVQAVINGDPSVGLKQYSINQPPTDRPVRIYADGVYDLFHFGHALQMRQAKLCFPSVHLLIGVCSDELCASHKSAPAMSHAERCESVRHCKWVDEVVPEAPWEITQEFLDEHEIDYVAHDDEPYTSAGKEDIYQFVKDQGKFLPTRRTPGISTSSLLERIVLGYRDGFFDSKLEKNGHAELKAELVDWESSSSAGRRGRTLGNGTESPQ